MLFQKHVVRNKFDIYVLLLALDKYFGSATLKYHYNIIEIKPLHW
jgi:hypothetical protein